MGKRDLVNELGGLCVGVRDHLAVKDPERVWPHVAMGNYFEKVFKAKETGAPLAWINFATIPELCWAMDTVPVSMDVLSGYVITTDEALTIKYIDLAEEHLPDFVCGLHKIAFGALLEGALPVPDMMITPTSPCDSGVSVYPLIAEYFNIPHYFIDVPYFRDKRSRDFLANELRKVVSFLEEQTKGKLDPDRLREVMEYSNRAHEINQKILKLAETVPCPVSSHDLVSDNGLMLLLSGTPDLVDRLEKRHEQAADRVRRKEGHLPQENLRLCWSYGTPMFNGNTLFQDLEKEYGAINVQILMAFDYNPPEDISNIDNIFSSLAEKVFSTPMLRECGGHAGYYMDRLIALARGFKADGCVFGGHVACQRAWGIAKLLTDKVQDELGIPTLSFELDFYDPRITPMETIKARLHDFITVVLKKGGAE